MLTKTLWVDQQSADKSKDDFVWPGVDDMAYGIDEESGGGSGGWKKGNWNKHAGFGGKDWKGFGSVDWKSGSGGSEMMAWKKKKMAIGRKKFIRCGVFCVRTKHGWETKPVLMRLGDNGCYSFLLPIKPTKQHKLFLV